MDIIGALGYSGQEFVFLGQENFGYITGRSICIQGIANGPKEMIWRPETGISKIASHIMSHRLAIAPEVAKFDVEVVDFLASNPPIFLKNPSSARIVDITFSRDGEHVFAISSSLDPKVFAWDLKTKSLTFVSDLPINFLNIAVNPSDWTKFVLSGDEGLYMGTIVEIMGLSAIKYDKIPLDVPEFNSHSNDEEEISSADGSIIAPSMPPTSVTFAVWAPFNRVFIGTKGGAIGELNAVELTLKLRAIIPKTIPSELNQMSKSPCVPLCATISSSNLVVGTSSGSVLWFPVVEIDTPIIPLETEGELITNILVLSKQSAQFPSAVRCLQADFMYVTVLAGTALGAIMKFPMDIAVVKTEDGDEDAAENTDLDRIFKPLDEIANQTITASQISVSQAGVVLCCKSISLPILSTSETSPKTSVVYCSIFITGSHTGVLTFWRQPSVDSEAIVKVKI